MIEGIYPREKREGQHQRGGRLHPEGSENQGGGVKRSRGIGQYGPRCERLKEKSLGWGGVWGGKKGGVPGKGKTSLPKKKHPPFKFSLRRKEGDGSY